MFYDICIYYYIVLDEITQELSNKFFVETIQDLLFKLTHIDVQKVFRKRFIGQDPDIPIYKFMTTAEVEKVCFLYRIWLCYKSLILSYTNYLYIAANGSKSES